MALRDEVEERYPSLTPLLRQPEIARLLTKAVRNNWSPGKFQSNFIASRWFRSQSASQRRWWVLTATDPTEAKAQRQLYSAELVKNAARLGVRLNAKDVKRYTESGLSQGIEAGSDRALANLLAFGQSRAGEMGPGAFKTAATAVRSVGAGDWMREPSRSETARWASDIALNRKTIEDFQAANAHAAAKRYPHMADAIRAGMTVAEVITPGVEAYAREMDWDPNQLMSKIHTNPQHLGLMGVRDKKSGKMRVPTEYEASVMARQRADWWQTSGGRKADAGMAQALLQTFGIRK